MDDKKRSGANPSVPFARPLLATALAVTALAPAAPAAAVDYFLKLEGINGESTNDKHKNEIDVESWQLGIAAATATASNKATGRTVCDGIALNKRVDAASVKLLEALFTGKPIGKGKLSVVTTGKDQQEFYTIDLGNITVGQINETGLGEASQLGESVLLLPAVYKFTYKQQKADGSLGGEITFSGSC